jgi:nucleoside-diphosphate-sugar epimerase
MPSAAVAHRAQLFVAQSLLGIYGDRKGSWVDESTPVPDQPGDVLQSTADLEGIVMAAREKDRLAAVLLRLGMFYSADPAQTRGRVEAIQSRSFHKNGDGSNFWNPLHVDDTAGAVVAAVDAAPSLARGVHNICDDAPVQMGALLEYVAETSGAPPSRRVPRLLGRLFLGGHVSDYLLASFRCHNDHAKAELNWTPKCSD